MEQVEVSPKIFRPGTKIGKTEVVLALNCGGIGDYIHWTSALRYTIDSNPHIFGHIVAPTWFGDLARLWLEGYSNRFKLRVTDDLNEADLQHLPWIVPGKNQLVNATGFHLFALGFYYYMQSAVIPEGQILPLVRGNEADVSRFNLPRRYAVLTPYATHDNRRINAKAMNEIAAWVESQGVTPVILGKKEVAADYGGKPPEELNLDLFWDLSEKTSLREAAVIMSGAEFVFGIDNGLLHLASCSKVPVVFYFTTVDPQLRVPPRQKGAKNIVITPPERFSCRFCNSNMRYIIGHNFKDCIYKDNLCVTSIKGSDVIEVLKKTVIRGSK